MCVGELNRRVWHAGSPIDLARKWPFMDDARGSMIGGLALFDAERTWAAEEATIAAAEADTNNDQIAVFFALGGGRS